jgi:hypothetical protein
MAVASCPCLARSLDDEETALRVLLLDRLRPVARPPPAGVEPADLGHPGLDPFARAAQSLVAPAVAGHKRGFLWAT